MALLTILSFPPELKNGDEIIPLSAGLESEMTAIFPLGKPEHNYTIEVRVKIMDSYLGTAETQFNVRVSENCHHR